MANSTQSRRPSKRQGPRHSAPSQNNRRRTTTQKGPLLLVIGIIALAAFVVGGVLLERTLTGANQQATSDQQVSSTEQAAQGTAQTQQPNDTQAPLASNAATTNQASPSSPVEPATIQVMMIGDVLMHDEIIDSGALGDGSYDFDFVFENIRDQIDAADLRILNQETVMGEPDMGYHLYMGSAGPIMNTPTALADSEARFGFNLILKATNHTLDRGYSGLAHELNYWKSAYPNMPVVGVNNPDALGTSDDSQNYVDNVYIYEQNGMKIGILNYTWATNENVDWSTDQQVISYLSEEKIRADVEAARAAGAEMIIACPHWGIEYTTIPSEEEETYSKLFTELGVDLILGAHPHILQPVELLRNESGHKTTCFYSVGNYVAASLMDEQSLIGGIARATLQRNADGSYAVTQASLVPTVICHTYGPHMSAFPLTSYTNDLAAESSRPGLTPDYAYAFCEDVLGAGFDPTTGVYTLDTTAEGRLV